MKRNHPLNRFIPIMAILTLTMTAGMPSVRALIVPTQNLFEADMGAGDINEFTPGGIQTTFASGLQDPTYLAFDGTGNLYAGLANNIIKISPSGVQSTFVSGLGPRGLAFNNAGNLFAMAANSIVEITPDGTQNTFASGILGGHNLAFDSTGNLFVTTLLGNRIYKIMPDGTVSVFVTGTIDTTRGPLAFDSEGDLFTGFGFNIYEYINNSGILSTIPILFSSALNAPTGLAFDNVGDLFESDGGTGNINEFINSGGTFSSTPVVFASGLNNPSGLAFQGLALPVPEPSSLALLAAGSAALLIRRRKN